MTDDPRPPESTPEDLAPPADEASLAPTLEEAGYLPPDPDEPPPLELWRAVGDVRPWGTVLVLLAWGGVFALMAARREFGDTAALLARGASVTQTDPLDAAWRLLASTFLHAGPRHVLFNALTFAVLGQALERIFARGAFALAYVVGGACASLASLQWRLYVLGVGNHLAIGGSGVVMALGGALLAAAWRLRHRLAVGRARAFAAVIMLATLPSLAGGFEHPGTDNLAHVGGLVAGALLGFVLPLREPLGVRPAGRAFGATGALAALALVAVVVRVVRG